MCSDFLYSFVWNISHSQNNLASYYHKIKQIYIQITFFLEFIHTWICWEIFEVLKYKIKKFVPCEPSSSK